MKYTIRKVGLHNWGISEGRIYMSTQPSLEAAIDYLDRLRQVREALSVGMFDAVPEEIRKGISV